MKESDQHRVTRWIDGELADDDVRDLLQEYPELLDDKREALQLGALLRQELPAEEEIPHADFFNHQIESQVMDEDPYPSTEPAKLFPIFERMKWTALAGAIAMVVLLCGLGMGWFGGGEVPADRSEIVSVYTPNPAHNTSVEWSSDADATLIKIGGLNPVPMGDRVAGFFPSTSERNDGLASTTYFSKDGRPVLVLTLSPLGLPRIRTIDL